MVLLKLSAVSQSIALYLFLERKNMYTSELTLSVLNCMLCPYLDLLLLYAMDI